MATSPYIDDDNITFPFSDGLIGAGYSFPVDGKVYYWKVRAEINGEWSLWSSINMFSNGFPNPPSILEPYWNQNVPGSEVTLRWTELIHSYHLQVSKDSSFEDLVVDTIRWSNQFNYTLTGLENDGTAYFWRVRARNLAGVQGPWSGVNFFVNGTEETAPPSPPQLESPGEGTYANSFEVTFDWLDGGVDEYSYMYHLQVSTTAFFPSQELDYYTFYINDYIYNNTSVDKIFPKNGTTFYWRVKAKNNAGWGDWSDVQTFINGPPPIPGPPVLIYPLGDEILGSDKVTFEWSKPSQHVEKYRLQIWKHMHWIGSYLNEDNIETNEYNISDLPQDGTYFYWRVQAYSDGGWGDWSSVGNFYSVPPESTSPVETGSLQVMIDPREARKAGAQWRLTEEGPDTSYTSWKNSGEIIDYVPPGEYTVTFKEVAGWEKPENILLEVIANQTATNTVTYDIKTYNIKLAAQPRGGNDDEGNHVEGEGDYDAGTRVTITAKAGDGYSFAFWTEDNIVVSTKSSFNFRVNSDRVLTAHFQLVDKPPEFNYVKLHEIPPEGGTAYGSGDYEVGESVVVIAQANPAYSFIGWFEGDTIVSTRERYSFTMGPEDRTLYAHFDKPDLYDVTVTAEPERGGTVYGGGTYESKQGVVVMATAAPGYSFAFWTEDKTIVSYDEIYSFKMGSEDRDLVAFFQVAAPATYNLTITTNPDKTGSFTGAGDYEAGAEVTVSASPITGYRFINWTENGTVVSNDAIYVFNMGLSDRRLVANFAPATYRVEVSAEPSTGGGVSGGGSYEQGASVTVSARANEGHRFVNWTEGGRVLSTKENYTFKMGASGRNLTANFEQVEIENRYLVALSANPPEGGLLSGAGYYEAGTSVKISALANEGYRFVNWTEGDSVLSTRANYTFKMGDSNRNLTANFVAEKAETYRVYATPDPPEGGSVSGEGSYNPRDRVTVTAAANKGYTFVNWTENKKEVSTTESYTFRMGSENRWLVANFRADVELTYTVTVSADPTDGGTVSGGAKYTTGDTVTVTAKANDGFVFVNWTELFGESKDGIIVSTNADYSFRMGSSDRILVANFVDTEAESCTVEVSAYPKNAGEVKQSGTGDYKPGELVTVYSEANPEYKFVNWTEGTTVVSTRESFSFKVESNRNLVANFQEIKTIETFKVALSANPPEGGLYSGEGYYEEGTKITVRAKANPGYVFVNWTENGKEVSDSADYTFTVESACKLVANFKPMAYTVKVSADPTDGGKVSGGGEYEAGTKIMVSAKANRGYLFAGWFEGDIKVSDNADYTFIVDSSRKLAANFEEETVQTSYTVYLYVNPEEGGTVRGGGDYEPGTRVTVSARANKGYTFHYWADSTGPVSKDERYTFTMGKSDVKLVAYFQRAP